MLIADRNGMLTLPYDAEVEYLESTGTQWIDTGVVVGFENDYMFIADLWVLSLSQYGLLFGDDAPDPYNATKVLKNNNSYSGFAAGFRRRANYMNTFNSPDIRKRITYRLSRQSIVLKWDGGEQANTLYEPSSGSNSTNSVKIGTKNQLMRIFSFDIIKADTTVMTLVPVRITNEQGVSEGAMYDRANPTVGMNPDGSPRTDGLYRNRGTGNFSYGADK